VLASGKQPSPFGISTWHSLSFSATTTHSGAPATTLVASMDGGAWTANATDRANGGSGRGTGMAGLGCGIHRAQFDDLLIKDSTTI
jgi:hypothetical protein